MTVSPHDVQSPPLPTPHHLFHSQPFAGLRSIMQDVPSTHAQSMVPPPSLSLTPGSHQSLAPIASTEYTPLLAPDGIDDACKSEVIVISDGADNYVAPSSPKRPLQSHSVQSPVALSNSPSQATLRSSPASSVGSPESVPSPASTPASSCAHDVDTPLSPVDASPSAIPSSLEPPLPSPERFSTAELSTNEDTPVSANVSRPLLSLDMHALKPVDVRVGWTQSGHNRDDSVQSALSPSNRSIHLHLGSSDVPSGTTSAVMSDSVAGPLLFANTGNPNSPQLPCIGSSPALQGHEVPNSMVTPLKSPFSKPLNAFPPTTPTTPATPASALRPSIPLRSAKKRSPQDLAELRRKALLSMAKRTVPPKTESIPAPVSLNPCTLSAPEMSPDTKADVAQASAEGSHGTSEPELRNNAIVHTRCHTLQREVLSFELSESDCEEERPYSDFFTVTPAVQQPKSTEQQIEDMRIRVVRLGKCPSLLLSQRGSKRRKVESDAPSAQPNLQQKKACGVPDDIQATSFNFHMASNFPALKINGPIAQTDDKYHHDAVGKGEFETKKSNILDLPTNEVNNMDGTNTFEELRSAPNLDIEGVGKAKSDDSFGQSKTELCTEVKYEGEELKINSDSSDAASTLGNEDTHDRYEEDGKDKTSRGAPGTSELNEKISGLPRSDAKANTETGSSTPSTLNDGMDKRRSVCLDKDRAMKNGKMGSGKARSKIINPSQLQELRQKIAALERLQLKAQKNGKRNEISNSSSLAKEITKPGTKALKTNDKNLNKISINETCDRYYGDSTLKRKSNEISGCSDRCEDEAGKAISIGQWNAREESNSFTVPEDAIETGEINELKSELEHSRRQLSTMQDYSKVIQVASISVAEASAKLSFKRARIESMKQELEKAQLEVYEAEQDYKNMCDAAQKVKSSLSDFAGGEFAFEELEISSLDFERKGNIKKEGGSEVTVVNKHITGPDSGYDEQPQIENKETELVLLGKNQVVQTTVDVVLQPSPFSHSSEDNFTSCLSTLRAYA